MTNLPSSTRATGFVYLIGAGPGDPKLLTLRALELLRSADVVLYDYLVNPLVTLHAPPSAEFHCLGKHGRTRIWTQDEINQCMIREAAVGRIVIRLKGGDPNIFGRLAEEVASLERARIPYEIVPGISAANAASAYAGVPLTSRDHASAVAFVTGHEQPVDQAASKLDFAALANFPGTLVVYMGVTTAAAWVAELITHGKPANTPSALIRRCSWPDQRVIRCELHEVPDQLTPYSKFPPPVIAMIGPVAAEVVRTSLNHRERQQLLGVTVLVTRPKGQQVQLVRQLELLGANVLTQPVIEIQPSSNPEPLFEAVDQIAKYDWLVFSSSNGVRYFLTALGQRGYDIRRLGAIKLATVGATTAAELAKSGLVVDLVPEVHRAEALADALYKQVHGKRVLLVRANRGRDLLWKRLSQTARQVDGVEAYCSIDITQSDPRIEQLLAQGQVDWTVVMSSASARSLVQLFGQKLQATRLASISPLTSEALRECGFEPAVEADVHSAAGVVEAIRKWHSHG